MSVDIYSDFLVVFFLSSFLEPGVVFAPWLACCIFSPLVSVVRHGCMFVLFSRHVVAINVS